MINTNETEYMKSARFVKSILESSRISTLSENEINRLIGDIKNPFILISGFREGFKLMNNRLLNGMLLTDFLKYKFKGRHIRVNCIKNNKFDDIKIVEECFIIIYNDKCGISGEQFKTLGIKEMRKFKQKAFIYSNGEGVFCISENGEEGYLDDSANLNINKLQYYYSIIKDVVAVFEGISEAKSSIHAYGIGALGLY